MEIERFKNIFILNAMKNGWSVKINKNKTKYVFIKKHNNNKDVYRDNFIEKFILSNIKDNYK